MGTVADESQSKSLYKNLPQYMGGKSFSMKWLVPTSARSQANLVIEQELCIDYLRNMHDYEEEIL